jgi:PAS domain S-box-containing protein
VLSVAIALGISRLMDIYLVSAPVALLLCAIMFSTWFSGVRAGFLAVALSILGFDYYFVTPIHSLAVDAKEMPRFSIFVLSALFVGLLSAAQRSARAALEKALRELGKSQDGLRLVIDTIPGMVWSARPDGSGDFLNQRWLDYTGGALEPERGWRWTSAFHPEDRAMLEDGWRASVTSGNAFEKEARAGGANGNYRWFLVHGVPLRDELGDVVRWYGTATDIDDRKRAEMLLAAEKRLLEMVARGESRTAVLDTLCRAFEKQSSGSLSSILLLDPVVNCLRHGAAPNLPRNYIEAIDGALIGPSAGSCGTAAYRAETVIVSDIATDSLWADYRDLALAHGLRACWSTPILSSQGRVLGTFATYYREPRKPVLHERNVIEQITHLASIAIEREQAEEVLREQARLLDLTHDTIFVRDMNDVITYWNRGAHELYEWTREDALDKVSHELMQTIFPAPLAEINAELLRTDRWEGELSHTKRDGTQVVVASRWSLQRDEQGRPVAILETNNDVTERKLAEAERARLGQRLRQAEKMEAVGRLAGGIAHDFNNVLAGILAYGEMLFEEAPADSSLKRYAQNVLTAATRGRALVEQILTYSRSQRGKRAPTDICRTVAETLELVRGSLPRNIHLDANVPGLPLVVIGDATQLHQVVMNLCSNSMHALGSGGTLRVGLTAAEVAANQALSHGTLRPGRYVRLSVEDSGCGMDQATLSRIFEPFFTTKDVGRGTGLGLSLVYAIVTDLGGAIDVKSALEQGSRFAIYLPLSEIAVAAAIEVENPLPRGNGERVLLVDDEEPLVAVTAEVLSRLGYEPVPFSDSHAALAAFEAAPTRFDVIVTDDLMPGLTGTGLARVVRRRRPDLPIVLVSGYSGPTVTQQALAAGVSELLTKPVQSREIAITLARVLHRAA